MRYIVTYGSNSQRQGQVESDSRDAKRLGRELLGTAGGGYVHVHTKTGKEVSYARYSPEGKGKWFSAQM